MNWIKEHRVAINKWSDACCATNDCDKCPDKEACDDLVARLDR
jgi:hypothetical protein